MTRDLMGLTQEYNDDRPFVLDAYDHTVQTGPVPVAAPVVEPVVEPAVAEVVIEDDIPVPERLEETSQAPVKQDDPAFDFRVAPEGE